MAIVGFSGIGPSGGLAINLLVQVYVTYCYYRLTTYSFSIALPLECVICSMHIPVLGVVILTTTIILLSVYCDLHVASLGNC